MLNKNALRDPDLVAVMQHHGFSYERNRDGSYRICVSDTQFKNILERYRLEYRPILQRIKRLHSDLHHCAHCAASPMTKNRLDHAPKAII